MERETSRASDRRERPGRCRHRRTFVRWRIACDEIFSPLLLSALAGEHSSRPPRYYMIPTWLLHHTSTSERATENADLVARKIICCGIILSSI